jgi:CBS domain containing-hemolysin-like protein
MTVWVMVAAGVLTFLSSVRAAYRNSSASTLEELAKRTGRQGRLSHYWAGLARDAWVVELLWLTTLGAFFILLFVATVGSSPADGFRPWAEFFLLLAAAAAATVAVPQAVAEPQAERIVLATLPLTHPLGLWLRPVYALGQLLRMYGGRLGGAPSEETPASAIAEEIISAALEGERAGALRQEQKQMIEGVIEFHNAPVREVMTPRTDIVFMHAEIALADAQRIAAEAGFSRYPVFERSRDEVVGVLHIRDLVGVVCSTSSQPTVRDLMRAPYFTPETTTVGTLLRHMRRDRVHLAVVLDEFGGTAGLVTLRDVLEEILGEIEDEFDQAAVEPIVQLVSGKAELSGRVRIEEVNEALGTNLPQDLGFETLGGLIFHMLGHIPRRGDTVTCGPVRLTVLRALERRASWVRLEQEPPPADRRAPEAEAATGTSPTEPAAEHQDGDKAPGGGGERTDAASKTDVTGTDPNE